MDSGTEYKRSIRGGNLIPRTNYPISPDSINMMRIGDVFGKAETEWACQKIICCLQQRGKGWAPFTLTEVNVNAHQKGFQDLLRRELVSKFIDSSKVGQEDTYIVSHEFVASLFCCSPSFELVSTDQIDD